MLKRLYCRLFHNSLMWPAHGLVRCRICFCQFPAWTAKVGGQQPAPRLPREAIIAGEQLL